MAAAPSASCSKPFPDLRTQDSWPAILHRAGHLRYSIRTPHSHQSPIFPQISQIRAGAKFYSPAAAAETRRRQTSIHGPGIHANAGEKREQKAARLSCSGTPSCVKTSPRMSPCAGLPGTLKNAHMPQNILKSAQFFDCAAAIAGFSPPDDCYRRQNPKSSHHRNNRYSFTKGWTDTPDNTARCAWFWVCP